MSKRAVLEGRFNLKRGQSVFARNDDSAVSAELRQPRAAGHAQHGPAQDRVPDPQPRFPAVAGQQRSGWGRKSACKPKLLEPSRVAFRRLVSGVPEVDLLVVGTSSPVCAPSGLHATAFREARQCEPPDKEAGLRFEDLADWIARIAMEDRDVGPVRAKSQVDDRRPGPARGNLIGQ